MVLTDTGLVATAFGWDLDFLRINLGDGLFSVYFSDTDKFRYFDEKKRKEFGDDFLAGLERKDMKFPEFVELVNNWKEGDKRYVVELFIIYTHLNLPCAYLCCTHACSCYISAQVPIM